ncbi:MAG: hypothetical protein WC329_02965 [Candidatus Omnitrophota bacterium]|jgi:TolA-binding protein
MTDDISRILGQLESSIKSLSEQQTQFRLEQREDLREIFDRLDDLSVKGCAIGRQNVEAIKELKARPEKLVGLGSAIASVLMFLANAVIWIVMRVKE